MKASALLVNWLLLSLAFLGASCGGGGADADTAGPTVSATSPASGATDVAVGATVSATFSEALACASVTGGAFTLSSGGAAVAGSVSCSGATVTFTPAAVLGSNGLHTAALGTAIRDLAGNALAAGTSWTFTTAAARVVFGEDFGDLYSVREDGTGPAAVADTLDVERIATQSITYESNTGVGLGNNPYRAPDTRPMVQGGRAVYQRHDVSGPADIFAANLDGTQRVALAATSNQEVAFAWIGDRVVYTSYDATAFVRNLRSVRLDGSGDVALTDLRQTFDSAQPLAFVGARVIFRQSGATAGTFISDADGANRITLSDSPAAWIIASGSRLLLGESTLAAVNLDGTGFVAFSPTANLAGSSPRYGPESLMFGIEAGRVFYASADQSTAPTTFTLVSVGLDGTNPLVLGSSTTTYPYVVEGAAGRLIVAEGGGDLVSYEIARAGSRTPLLVDHRFMLLQGGRVVGYSANGNGTYKVSSVNPDGTAVATLALAAVELDGFHLVRVGQGQLVYLQAAANGLLEGRVVGLDGSGNAALTTGVAGDKELMDVVAGRLVFQSHAAGDLGASRNLHSVRLDGTGARDHANTSADERYLGQFDSGTKLLFTSASAGVVELKVTPMAGGAPVLLWSSPAGKSFIGAY